MADPDNVVVVSFEDDSKPYQALSALKSLTDQDASPSTARPWCSATAPAPCTHAG
jgi:hypothetical protein